MDELSSDPHLLFKENVGKLKEAHTGATIHITTTTGLGTHLQPPP
jgi:hypothetical protein